MKEENLCNLRFANEALVIRTVKHFWCSCFLTFLQNVVEKLMKVRSVMVSGLASGKYDSISIVN